MFKPVYKWHDFFKVELTLTTKYTEKKDLYEHTATTSCMPDKLFNVYNQFSTVVISTQTNKEKLKKKTVTNISIHFLINFVKAISLAFNQQKKVPKEMLLPIRNKIPDNGDKLPNWEASKTFFTSCIS